MGYIKKNEFVVAKKKRDADASKLPRLHKKPNTPQLKYAAALNIFVAFFTLADVGFTPGQSRHGNG